MSEWARYSKNLVSPWVHLKDEKYRILSLPLPYWSPRLEERDKKSLRSQAPVMVALSSGFRPRQSQRRTNVGLAPHRLHLRDWHPHCIPGRGRPHPLYVRAGLLPSPSALGVSLPGSFSCNPGQPTQTLYQPHCRRNLSFVIQRFIPTCIRACCKGIWPLNLFLSPRT